MYFISVMAITEAVARDQAAVKAGYERGTIGQVVTVVDQGTNSRQKAYVFATTNDVTRHPLFAGARLSDTVDTSSLETDGPVLAFGPEVTVGG